MNADTQQKILDAVDAGFDAQLATTMDFVAIPSTRGAEGPCQDMIGDLLRQRGYEVDDWHINVDDLKDLRGFGPHRRGCVYELETLLDTVPLDRLVFLIDWSTDRQGLEDVLFSHWQRLATDSPNLTTPDPAVRLLNVGGGDAAAVRQLLAIAEAHAMPATA